MGKASRNISMLFMMGLLVFLMSSLVVADETEEALPLESFEITSGLDREKESTFDAARTIAGTAEKDTFIIIRTYRYDDNGEELELHYYEITVGASGMFTQIMELRPGENRIEIKAALDGRETVKTALIRRKKQEIKRELEQGATIIELS